MPILQEGRNHGGSMLALECGLSFELLRCAMLCCAVQRS